VFARGLRRRADRPRHRPRVSPGVSRRALGHLPSLHAGARAVAALRRLVRLRRGFQGAADRHQRGRRGAVGGASGSARCSPRLSGGRLFPRRRPVAHLSKGGSPGRLSGDLRQSANRARPGLGDHRGGRADRREDAEPRLPAHAGRRLSTGADDDDRHFHHRCAGARLRSARPFSSREGDSLDETNQMMASGSPQLRLEAIDVGFTYSGESATRALEALSLTVEDQEFLAVLGPVGCGKTTLLRIFAGFLRPTHGSVRCDGESVDGTSQQRGYVLQENAIFPWMTVRENIEFGLLARGVEPPARRAASDELLGLLGLAAFEAAYPKELSAGMSKMVEVARVLATDPSMLLLDEPFGALDAQTRARMQDELARLWEQRRQTALFVTHDAPEALHL